MASPLFNSNSPYQTGSNPYSVDPAAALESSQFDFAIGALTIEELVGRLNAQAAPEKVQEEASPQGQKRKREEELDSSNSKRVCTESPSSQHLDEIYNAAYRAGVEAASSAMMQMTPIPSIAPSPAAPPILSPFSHIPGPPVSRLLCKTLRVALPVRGLLSHWCHECLPINTILPRVTSDAQPFAARIRRARYKPI